jgi:hypothetical protein
MKVSKRIDIKKIEKLEKEFDLMIDRKYLNNIEWDIMKGNKMVMI